MDDDNACVFQEDIYTKHQWLEIMPKAASKARAVLQLKEHLGCDRLVVFGDQKNDIDMSSCYDFMPIGKSYLNFYNSNKMTTFEHLNKSIHL